MSHPLNLRSDNETSPSSATGQSGLCGFGSYRCNPTLPPPCVDSRTGVTSSRRLLPCSTPNVHTGQTVVLFSIWLNHVRHINMAFVVNCSIFISHMRQASGESIREQTSVTAAACCMYLLPIRNSFQKKPLLRFLSFLNNQTWQIVDIHLPPP